MSRRAIRRLQENHEPVLLREDESDDEDEEEDVVRDGVGKAKRGNAFLAVFDDDDDDDDDSSSDDDDDDDDDGDSPKKSTGLIDDDDDDDDEDILSKENSKLDDASCGNESKIVPCCDTEAKSKSNITTTTNNNKQIQAKTITNGNAKPIMVDKNDVDDVTADNDDDDDDDDLDAILAEFQSPKTSLDVVPSNKTDVNPSNSYFQIITDGMDVRDLDIEYVIRTSLSSSSSSGGNHNTAEAPSRRINRRTRLMNLFGNPRDDWIRPPHYVGGGIGMTTYDVAPRPIPWPYNNNNNNKELNENGGWNDPRRWFRFQCSDSYRKDCNDYIQIQQTGDVNALALFISHHPFVTDALLQLAMVLYQTNQHQEGLLLIRRTLWIYECSSLPGFTPQEGGVTCWMDYHQLENSPFFLALFRLMQVSSIAGCMRTSLAVSRYLLSLDPLRDPVGVLLIMDYFAISCYTTVHAKWLVDLVESGKVHVFHRIATSADDDEPMEEYQAELVDLPNFAFSYALAMYNLHEWEDASSGDVSWLERSNLALQKAIQKFPTVVEMLLVKNEVDITGRSLQTDWKMAMPFLRQLSAVYYSTTAEMDDRVDDLDIRRATLEACELMIRIFVDRNYKLWGSDGVLRWLYRNVVEIITIHNSSLETASLDQQQQPTLAPAAVPSCRLSPALMRYAPMDPEDYADRIRTLPPEANPLDPNLLVPALAMNANRRRFLQRNPRFQQQQQADEWEQQQQQQQQQQDQFAGQILIGGPPTHVLDPDVPLMELFWRSAFPWNRVDGVPPPRR